MNDTVFVVTYTISETCFDESWVNHEVVGCFYDEQKAYEFARDYEHKIVEEHKGQTGWGYPNCEVHKTEIK